MLLACSSPPPTKPSSEGDRETQSATEKPTTSAAEKAADRAGLGVLRCNEENRYEFTREAEVEIEALVLEKPPRVYEICVGRTGSLQCKSSTAKSWSYKASRGDLVILRNEDTGTPKLLSRFCPDTSTYKRFTDAEFGATRTSAADLKRPLAQVSVSVSPTTADLKAHQERNRRER